MNNPIEIYQTENGETQVEVRFEQETVWLSQAQMVQLFGRNQSVISHHIDNAVEEGEISEKSNMQKMHIASADCPVTFYDLETIISVGYRIKSPQSVAFRRWATARLKDYLVKGYALNQSRLQQNATELSQALAVIKRSAYHISQFKTTAYRTKRNNRIICPRTWRRFVCAIRQFRTNRIWRSCLPQH
ncbi:RhuM family protein [Kingella negevensis]|uniref:virulence RhuM family protein n=1 Tax=Kingella negevensis TaxID=1522312 RepID=UPI0025431505|nr:RhuM family protein [Kingella negevensis]WII92514.1 RhuM family protein [Kingella negevensis]